MAFREEWTPTGPPLTIEVLYAQGHPQVFQYGERIYIGFAGVEGSDQGGELHYLAIAHTEPPTHVPTRFVGSMLVTPVVANVTPLY